MDMSGPVLLFDGECGLCARCVKWLLRLDRNRRLRFAPLQGGAAQHFLRQRGLATADFSSALFVPDWEHRNELPARDKTDALLAALGVLGGIWRLATVVVRLVPRAWRDVLYDRVARHRKKIWGKAVAVDWQGTYGTERFLG